MPPVSRHKFCICASSPSISALIILYVITLMILGEAYEDFKLESSSFSSCLHSPVASSVFVSNMRIKTSCKLDVLLVRQEIMFQTPYKLLKQRHS